MGSCAVPVYPNQENYSTRTQVSCIAADCKLRLETQQVLVRDGAVFVWLPLSLCPQPICLIETGNVTTERRTVAVSLAGMSPFDCIIYAQIATSRLPFSDLSCR